GAVARRPGRGGGGWGGRALRPSLWETFWCGAARGGRVRGPPLTPPLGGDPPQLPPIAKEPFSVLLLGQSDRPGLEEALAAWITFLNGLNQTFEIILVDDALFDRTVELGKHHPAIRVLRDPVRRGSGAALRLGLTAAQHPLLLYAPCDGSFQPKDMKLLFDQIDQVHVVVGHRVGRRVPFPLRVLGFCWRLLLRVLF